MSQPESSAWGKPPQKPLRAGRHLPDPPPLPRPLPRGPVQRHAARRFALGIRGANRNSCGLACTAGRTKGEVRDRRPVPVWGKSIKAMFDFKETIRHRPPMSSRLGQSPQYASVGSQQQAMWRKSRPNLYLCVKSDDRCCRNHRQRTRFPFRSAGQRRSPAPRSSRVFPPGPRPGDRPSYFQLP